MAKRPQVSFVCQECGYDTPAFLGKCPECGVWNSLREVQSSKFKVQSSRSGKLTVAVIPKRLSEINSSEKQRIQTGFIEFDTVLGGGIVPGGAILLAGDPGVGKSTLLLQLALSLASSASTAADRKVLYISGEESIEQIKMRAERLAHDQAQMNNGRKKSDWDDKLLLLSVTDPDEAIGHIHDLRPDFVVVDSIQTMQSENVAGLSGSVAQVRYSALHFIRCAKQNNIPIILVGHVTKDGMVAGPMVLSHMVDVLLFLEGEKFATTRILRSLKNRFGPVDEVGIFQMDESGMREVRSPEFLFLTKEKAAVPGSALAVTMEGTRPFLVELQALVVYSKLPMPRRVISGVPERRVELLLAVLQKHCQLPVDTMDVYVNVVGGIKLVDPGVDLGVCIAVFSSLKNVSVVDTVGIAEVGLLGELRPLSSLDKRVKEAQKLGFKKIVSSKTHRTLQEALSFLGRKSSL